MALPRITNAEASRKAGSTSRPGDPCEWTDARLMTGIAQRDDVALAELERRFRSMIVAYAATLLDPDTAEDVAQEVFLRVYRHAQNWQPVGSLRTYLLHITRNLSLNERRRAGNLRSMLTAARTRFTQRRTPTPADTLDEREARRIILAALERMPERRRDVFGLVRFGGLSYADVAVVTGTSPQTVANQMSAAMADIRRALDAAAEGS